MFIKLNNKEGLTLKDLKELVAKCDENNTPDYTIVEMDHSDTDSYSITKAVIADDESIRFYNYI